MNLLQAERSNAISEEVNTTEINDETPSLTGQELGDVNSAGTSIGAAVTSEKVARQLKAATDLLTKQVE